MNFKFRAWNGKEMIPFSFDDIYAYEGEVCGVLLPNGEMLNNNSGYGKHGINKSLVLMQFTGLKDKNGKLIFEGDLVHYKYLEGDKPFEVIYDHDTAAFKIAKDEYYMGFLGDKKRHEIQVIGNIYKNPELLK